MINEQLLSVEDEAPREHSFYLMDSLDDLVGIATFESTSGTTHEGVRVTLIDLAKGEVIHVRIPNRFSVTLHTKLFVIEPVLPRDLQSPGWLSDPDEDMLRPAHSHQRVVRHRGVHLEVRRFCK